MSRLATILVSIFVSVVVTLFCIVVNSRWKK